MLKRAVFGPLGLPVAMRRRPGKADAPLPPAHAKTTCSRSASSKATSASRGGRKSGDISSEGIRISDEPDTDDAETLSDKGDDSEGESNPFEDPQVRKALIRRAAALYAEDGKRFLQAMQKHEKHGGEEDTEEDLTLFDPQSEDSMDDVAVKRTKRRVKGTEVKLEEGSGQEDDDVTAEEGFTRGKFHCKLCPKKIFIFEADLEKHLESRVHKRRQRRWEKLQQPLAGGDGKETQMKNAETSAEGKEGESKQKKEGKRKKSHSSKRSERRRDVASLTPEDIQRRKEKFQRKKHRRMERKALSCTPC